MKRVLFIIVLPVFFIFLMQNVNAEVTENSFTDAKCITSMTWRKAVKTEYNLNTEEEIYQISGKTYQDALLDQEEKHYIFYAPSDDEEELYAFVPNYNEIVKNQEAKEELLEMGILTTENCSSTFVVKKTMIGKLDRNKNKNEEDIDVVDDDGTGIKIGAPDTASPLKISIIAIGVILILLVTYGILNKYDLIPKWRKK